MLEYRYDTQLLIEGAKVTDEEIIDYISNNIPGDCLLVVGDAELMKLHFHTNVPWKLLEYCSYLGTIYDIVVENMERQAQDLRD